MKTRHVFLILMVLIGLSQVSYAKIYINGSNTGDLYNLKILDVEHSSTYILYKPWYSQITGTINVKNESDGDFVYSGTDVTTAFQTAYDSLKVIGGGTLVVKGGTYTKSDVTRIYIHSNTTTYMSPSTKIVFGNDVGADAYFFQSNDTTNVVMSGGIIDGNKVQQISGGINFGIAFVNVSNSIIENVNIKDIGTSDALSGYGIYLKNSTNNIVTKNKINGVKRESIVVYYNSDNNIISYNNLDSSEDRHIVSHDAGGNLIIGNILNISAGRGIDIFATSGLNYGNKIINNQIAGVQGTSYAISIDNQSDMDVSHNTILNSSGDCIELIKFSQLVTITSNTIRCGSRAVNIPSTSNQIIITDNILTKGTYGVFNQGTNVSTINNKIYNSSVAGIDDRGTNSIIAYNTITDNWNSGISITVGNRISIYNNQLSNNGGVGGGMDNGITVGSTSTNVTISGNFGYSGTKQVYGIRIMAGARRVYVFNNPSWGMGNTADILDNTASAVIRDNVGTSPFNHGTNTTAPSAFGANDIYINTSKPIPNICQSTASGIANWVYQINGTSGC